jgi:hypothetical protein
MMRICIVVFLSLLVSNLNANDSISTKTNLIGISTGYGYHSNIDPYASSNVYGGSFLPIRLSFQTFNNKYSDELILGYFSVKLKPLIQTENHLTNFNSSWYTISYSYQRKILKHNNNSTYLGASINSWLTFKELNFKFYHNVVYQPVDLFNSLNLSVVNKTVIRNDILFIRFKYMIISYIMYNKYSLGSPFTGDFFNCSKCNSYDLYVSYNFCLSRFVFLNFGYQFYFYSFPKYKNVEITKGIYNQFLIGLNVKL